MSRSIKVESAALANELAWLTRARSTQPVQIDILLGALRLRHTDYELFRESMLPGGGGGQASVLVDPVRLRELLKGTYGFALVDITDTGLSVAVDGRTIKLRGDGPAGDAPPWPVFASGDSGAAAVTARQLERALTSVSGDPTLPALGAVQFGAGFMVSTDRFRLSRIAYTTRGNRPIAAMVPADALSAFTHAAALVIIDQGTAGNMDVMRVSSDNRSIIARMMVDEFPKWQQLIPDDDNLSLIALIRRDELLGALNGEDVTLTVGQDSILVTSADRNGDVEVEQQIGILKLLRGDDLPFTIRMSRENLRGCLKSVSTGALQFKASAPNKPVVLQGVGDADLHLIMPIRIPT
jgi:hypothetical protein